MKRIFITLMLACSLLSLSARDNGYFGIRGGLDISIPKSGKFKLFDPGVGSNIGAVYNIPVVSGLYVEPGVNLYYNTWKIPFEVGAPDMGLQQKTASTVFRNFGVGVPVMLGWKFGDRTLGYSLFTGPELRVGITNRSHWDTNVDGFDDHGSKSMYDKDGMYRRVDCGWKVGMGIDYNNYYFAVTGLIGLVDVSKNTSNGQNYHNNNVTISVGYNF